MLRNIPLRILYHPPTETLRVPGSELVATVNTLPFTLGSLGWSQQSVASAGTLSMQVPGIPTRGRLLEARFRIDPGVHVSLPATLPTFKVFRYLPGDLTQLGATVTDPSATVPVYNAAHSVVVPNLNFELTPTSFDWIQATMTGETGANSVVGLNLEWIEFLIGLPSV